MSKLDELLREMCPEGVEWVRLNEVCNISKGVQFNKRDMHAEGTYPVINGGVNASGYIEQYNQNENTAIISQGGASAGFVNWMDTKFWAGAHCYVLEPTDEALARYLFHFVKSKERELQKQQRIVNILDRFDSLCNDLTSGIPAEIELRRKQYAYYRDWLLKFEEAA